MHPLLLLIAAGLAPADSTVLEERVDIFDPVSMAFRGSEVTWFDVRGRRLRLEITNADGDLTLLFIVRHDAQGRESEAIYFEGGSTEPTREVFTYSPGLKTTTYFYEPGVASERTESILDATGREIRKRYYRSDGTQYGEEDVLWAEDGTQAGWDFRYVGRPGGTEFRYEYLTRDASGAWTRRIRYRDSEAERLEVRTRVWGSVQPPEPTTVSSTLPTPWVPPSGSPVVPSRECGSLDQLLGPSSAELRMSRPLWRLRACPNAAGAALSEAVEAMGAIADTVELERRTWLTHYVVDERIVTAALKVAADAAHTREARIYALRTLIWQKAPGHLITPTMLTAEAPGPNALPISSSYTNHYYTDLGYGDGEHPWPVLGEVPGDGYVRRMQAAIERMDVADDDRALANARAWFLWYEQDAELAELLSSGRSIGGECP